MGIDYIEARHFLDINAQVISIKEMAKAKKLKKLLNSNALILNIDYPLGFGAYMVLSTILRNVSHLKGVYILGKASFLNGDLGDIALPTTVFDEHSKNTFVFKNAFSPSYFSQSLAGRVLINQKVISSKGTLLTPQPILEEYFEKGVNIIEMEDGPYLNAIYETINYNRYPENETIALLNSPVDIGIIHYASDTPFTKTVTLGTRSLGYEGVEATYTSSLAILKRIIEMETQ